MGKVGQNVTKYAVPIANGLAAGAMSTAVELNNMLRAKQLDPFLGPAVAAGATTVAAGLNSLASGVARLAPYAPYALLGVTDVVLGYGVAKEGIAAAKGQCKP